jgi:hypothetical protein
MTADSNDPQLPSYRELAGKNLAQAAAELNGIPTGRIATDVMAAHAAKAQAAATIAVAQALLHVGDVLSQHAAARSAQH